MQIKQIVFDILQNDVRSRSDDMYLLARVIERMNGKNAHTEPIIGLFEHWYINGLPNINTVKRERQFIQAKHADLRDPEAAAIRAEQESVFRSEYGKG